MLRRLAALVFAVVVVAGGVAIRDARKEAGNLDTGTDATDVSDPYEVFDDDQVSVLCADELAGLCDALDLMVSTTRVEPAWTTVDRLAGGGGLGADAWITFRPLDGMAAPPDAEAASRPLGPGILVARSPITLAGPPADIAAIEQACPDPRLLLSCAGAGTAGLPELTMRDPRTSPAGALALSAVADELGVAPAGVLAGTEPGARLAALIAGARITPVPYEDVARLKSGSVALTLEADVAVAIRKLEYDKRRTFDGVSLLYPFEARAAEIVMAPAREFSRPRDLAGILRSQHLSYSIERAGFETTFRRAGYLDAEKAFARRPTIRTDLPPPPPARLQELRRPLAGVGP